MERRVGTRRSPPTSISQLPHNSSTFRVHYLPQGSNRLPERNSISNHIVETTMLNRKSLLLTSGLVLSSVFPLTVAAFGPHPNYDLNGDGKITPEEVQTARAAEFTQIDADANGYISFAEMQAWADAKKTAHFTKVDTDGNGSLTEAEFIAGKPKHAPEGMSGRIFKLLDTDGNGALSLAEFKVMRGSDHLIFHFARIDADGDNQISNAEFLAAPVHKGHRGGKAGGPNFEQDGPH